MLQAGSLVAADPAGGKTTARAEACGKPATRADTAPARVEMGRGRSRQARARMASTTERAERSRAFRRACRSMVASRRPYFGYYGLFGPPL
ncbi:MAG: hypothetical protein M0Z69_00610 [Actinomycetota bacterium]|nr:hypothetical protein [Actinomycetota bacterium]